MLAFACFLGGLEIFLNSLNFTPTKRLTDINPCFHILIHIFLSYSAIAKHKNRQTDPQKKTNNNDDHDDNRCFPQPTQTKKQQQKKDGIDFRGREIESGAFEKKKEFLCFAPATSY